VIGNQYQEPVVINRAELRQGGRAGGRKQKESIWRVFERVVWENVSNSIAKREDVTPLISALDLSGGSGTEWFPDLRKSIRRVQPFVSHGPVNVDVALMVLMLHQPIIRRSRRRVGVGES
jgi:hypothetical protein